jgi:hypothetical protein
MYKSNNTTGAYSFCRKWLFINMSYILTAVKEGIHSYWDRVYSCSNFNQMWILKYWIFWIIVITVLFQKLRLSFLHFTDRSPWKSIKTFENIMKNGIMKAYYTLFNLLRSYTTRVSTFQVLMYICYLTVICIPKKSY